MLDESGDVRWVGGDCPDGEASVGCGDLEVARELWDEVSFREPLCGVFGEHFGRVDEFTGEDEGAVVVFGL